MPKIVFVISKFGKNCYRSEAFFLCAAFSKRGRESKVQTIWVKFVFGNLLQAKKTFGLSKIWLTTFHDNSPQLGKPFHQQKFDDCSKFNLLFILKNLEEKKSISGLR